MLFRSNIASDPSGLLAQGSLIYELTHVGQCSLGFVCTRPGLAGLLTQQKNIYCGISAFEIDMYFRIGRKIKNPFLLYLVDVEMLEHFKMSSAFIRIVIFIIN